MINICHCYVTEPNVSSIVIHTIKSTCPVHTFTCNNGECIQNVLLCDGVRHCQDGSDETHQCVQNVTSTERGKYNDVINTQRGE